MEFDNATPRTKMTEDQKDEHTLGVILAEQFSLKEGLRLCGDDASAALMKEASQIDALKTFTPQKPSELTYEAKHMALEAMMLILQKRPDSEGKQLVKGRLVAVGSKQRSHDGYKKSDGSSPTVKTDSIFLTGVIDAR